MRHFLPHDAINTPVATESSVAGYFGKFMMPYEIVPRVQKKAFGVEAGRVAFDKVTFHKENCKQGLNCLRDYHRKFDEKLKIYSEEPVHNWASHGSDAFMQFGQALQGGLLSLRQESGILYNRVNTRGL